MGSQRNAIRNPGSRLTSVNRITHRFLPIYQPYILADFPIVNQGSYGIKQVNKPENATSHATWLYACVIISVPIKRKNINGIVYMPLNKSIEIQLFISQ